MSESKLEVTQNWHQEAPETPRSYQGSPEMAGESQLIHLNPLKCEHYYERRNATEFWCKKCLNGYIDGGKFKIENGQISFKTTGL